MMKRNKWVKIAIVALLLIVLLLLGIWALKNHKETQTRFLQGDYNLQNQAFSMEYNSALPPLDWEQHLPYEYTDEVDLQMKLNCFNYETGSTLTRPDIEAFLATPTKTDGSPRTYKHDNGIIYAYVDWYRTTGTFNAYKNKIELLKDVYLDKNPWTPELANELHKKYLDPTYELGPN